MPRTELIQRIMDSIDKMDAKAFSEFITEDGTFKYANSEPVKGRENIRNYVDGFFKMIRSGKHNIVNLWDNEDSIVWQGEVTYTRHDEKVMTFPFVNVFYMKGDMITDYLIHIDNTPLFAA